MGCDANYLAHKPGNCMVSIHAPAWGATSDIDLIEQLLDVSIHAPAWGATFQPISKQPILRVSIHAPAWGAT